ncbi:MAG: (Fe-S)-binding protein [Promethearchaeota archaeon]
MGFITKLKKYKWMIRLILNTKWKDKKLMIRGFKNAKQYLSVPEDRHKSVHTDMKELLKCTLCPNMCRFDCPTLRVTMKEMYAPATKARISYHMERGDISMNDLHTAEVAYICTNCNACQYWCPMDISVGDLLKGVRADLVDNGVHLPKVKSFVDKLDQNKTAFEKDVFIKNPELDINHENPEVFFYMGCVTAEKKPESAKATEEILENANVRFCTMLQERNCCGNPSYTLGYRDVFKEFAEKNVELFKKSGAKIIVSDCPACAAAIKEYYPKVGVEHDFKVLTTSQYFKQLIKEGKIRPQLEVDDTITYHDPCYIARRLEKQEYVDTGDLDFNKRYNININEESLDSARWIFSRIPGLSLKEPQLHGAQTQCCGRGGVSHVHHSEISQKITEQRVKQLNETGANTFVSACPSCEDALGSVSGKGCLDISEILIKSIKKK